MTALGKQIVTFLLGFVLCGVAVALYSQVEHNKQVQETLTAATAYARQYKHLEAKHNVRLVPYKRGIVVFRKSKDPVLDELELRHAIEDSNPPFQVIYRLK